MLEIVVKATEGAGVRINNVRYQYCTKSVEYLRQLFSDDVALPIPEKVRAIIELIRTKISVVNLRPCTPYSRKTLNKIMIMYPISRNGRHN